MKRLVLPLAVLLLACVSTPARAQFQLGQRPTTPFGRPAVSPFVNLFRGGAGPGINYYGIVRPQRSRNTPPATRLPEIVGG